ncbi:hypothetical protein FRX31_013346, partial [Thalictrum thalictroides]
MFLAMEMVSEYMSRRCDDMIKEVKSEYSRLRGERKTLFHRLDNELKRLKEERLFDKVIAIGNSIVSLILQIKQDDRRGEDALKAIMDEIKEVYQLR